MLFLLESEKSFEAIFSLIKDSIFLAMSSDFSGGYDARIFVVKPADGYVCPLCLNIINDPQQCKNGHGFCNTCIRKAIATRKECPVCKVYLTADLLGRSLFAHNGIHSISTFCISSFDEFSIDLSEAEKCTLGLAPCPIEIRIIISIVETNLRTVPTLLVRN